MSVQRGIGRDVSVLFRTPETVGRELAEAVEREGFSVSYDTGGADDVQDGYDAVVTDTEPDENGGVVVALVDEAAEGVPDWATDRVVREGDWDEVLARRLAEYLGRGDDTGVYEAVVEQSRDGVAVVQDGAWRYVNPRLLSMLGETEEGMLGEPFHEWFVGEDRELVRERYEERIEGDEPTSQYDVRMSGADGEVLNVEVSVTRGRFEGEPATVASIRDISDRKGRERELKRYETVIESLDDAVYVLDEEGRFVYVNDRFLSLTGYDEREVVGSPPSLIKDEEAVSRGERELARVLSDDGPDSVRFEVDIRTADGEAVTCEDHMGALWDEGEFEGSAGVLRDVTERIERERELEEYESIVESGREVLWMFEPGFTEKILVNPAYEDVFGQSADALDENPTAFLDATHPDDRAVMRRKMEEVSNGETVDFEARVNADEGYGRWVWIRGQPVYDDGEMVAVSGFARDITERKERKRELERSRSLLEAQQEAMDAGVLVSDAEGRVLSYNDEFLELWGISEEVLEEGDGASLDWATDRLADPEGFIERVEHLYENPEETDRDEVELEDGRFFDRYTGPVVGEDGTHYGRLWIFRDITERKERQRDLRRLSKAVEASMHGVGVVDGDVFEYANPAHAEIYGYEDASDLVGRSWRELYDDEELGRFDDEILPELRREGEWSGELVGVRKDGERFDQELSLSLIEDEDAIVCAVRDITDRKQRERELERSRNRLSVALEGADAGVWEWDPETDEVFWHESTERLFGVEADEFGGTYEDFVDYVPEEGLETLEREIEDALPEREPFVARYPILRGDGERRWVKARGRYVDTPHSSPRYIGVITDITALKERERELRVRTRAMEKAETAFCLTDPSQEDNPIVYANEAFLELTGYDEDEVIGRNCRFLQGEGTDEGSAAELRRGVENEEPVDVEILNYTSDGDEFWNRLHVSPIYDSEGNLVHYFGSQRDITESVERRERLQETNRLLNLLNRTVRGMLSATSSVQVRELTREAATELGGDADYHVWSDDEGALVSVSSGETVSKGPGWAAYTTGEPFVTDDIVVFPVGEDGVVCLETGEDTRDSVDEFLRSLAASAEAALERFERRSEIVSLTESLVERKESLESLSEVDEVVRDMTRELPGETDKEAAAETVCEALLGVDNWDFAWMGSPTVDGCEVYGSTDDAFAEALREALSSDPNAGAFGDAAWGDEPRFVESIASMPASPWRRAALDRGYLSAASVPVSHSGTTYCVLEVYSKEAGAFSEMYEAALRDTSEIAGYAVASAERRNRSVGEGRTALTVSVPEEQTGGPIPRIAAGAEGSVAVERHEEKDGGYGAYLSVEGADPETVAEAAAPEEVDISGGVVALTTPGCAPLSAAERVGGSLRSCRVEDGRGVFEITVPSQGDSGRVMDLISEECPGTELVSNRTVSDRDGPSGEGATDRLTERQREVLETAYYEGFFDWPRKANGEELAEELGVSAPTLHEHLREAERKVVSSVLEG